MDFGQFVLFPFDGTNRLRCQVIQHTVDALDLASDTAGDLMQRNDSCKNIFQRSAESLQCARKNLE